MVSYKIILMAAAVGIIPVVGWIWLIIKEKHLNIKGINWLLKVFFWGVLSAIPASFFEIAVTETGSDNQLVEIMGKIISFHGGEDISLFLLISTALMASIEELSKGLIIALVVFKDKINTTQWGVFVGMTVGLAFGVTENGVYFATAINSGQALAGLTSLILLRFLLSTSAHIIYSGLMGSFLVERKMRWLKIILAFSLPIIIHTVFNILLGTSLMFITPLVIFFGFIWLWLRYHKNN